MKFDFKLKLNKEEIFKKQLIYKIGTFWQRIHKIIFFIFLIAAIFLGGYIWSNSLFGNKWSAEKKQQYLDDQNRGVVLNEDIFKKALKDVELRKQDVTDLHPMMKDIFQAY